MSKLSAGRPPLKHIHSPPHPRQNLETTTTPSFESPLAPPAACCLLPVPRLDARRGIKFNSSLLWVTWVTVGPNNIERSTAVSSRPSDAMGCVSGRMRRPIDQSID